MEAYVGSRDISVKTGGHCFLCLSKVDPQFLSISMEVASSSKPKSESESFQPMAIFYYKYSLQYLCHYLKLKGGAVPNDQDQDKDEIKDSKKLSLNAVLCGGCAALNMRFSKLYQQLERIQMEVSSCLGAIQGKLVQPEESIMENQMRSFLSSDEVTILKELRKGTMEKCLLKLARTAPRVKIERLAQLAEINLQPLLEMEMGHPPSSPEMEVEPESESSPQLDLEQMNMNMQMEQLSPPDTTQENDTESFSAAATEDKFKSILKLVGIPESDRTSTNTAFRNQSRRLTMRRRRKKTKNAANNLNFQLNPQTGKFRCGAVTCEKEFSSMYIANYHYESVHLKLKSFGCKICGKQFSLKGSLKTHHQTVHLQIKPYQCDKCGTQFSQIGNYQTHERGCAPNLGRYKCHRCTERFREYSSLKEHQRTVHCEVKWLQCDHCDKHFSTSPSLRDHLEAVHLKIKYDCDQCGNGKQFRTKRQLRSHLKVVHKTFARRQFARKSTSS